FLHARADDAQRAAHGAYLDAALLDLVVGPHHREQIAALHLDERFLGHQQRAVARILPAQAHAPVLAGAEQALAVGEERLDLDGAGAGIDLAIASDDDAAV